MLLAILFPLLALAYCGIAGYRCACIDEDYYERGIIAPVWAIMLRGMLWPVTVAGWLVERPAQLLLPPPGEDTP